MLRRTLFLAILCAFASVLCAAAYDASMQHAIAAKVTRVQIVAHTDTDADQDIKRAVRDRVLALATELTRDCATVTEANAKITAALPSIESAAQETVYACGRAYAVRASLCEVAYPTRVYGAGAGQFALPAGTYIALRVSLGEASGENWWCVAFPALCLPSAEPDAAARAAGFSEAEVAYIRADAPEVRFWVWEKLRWIFRRP